jgi:hypothetical protein
MLDSARDLIDAFEWFKAREFAVFMDESPPTCIYLEVGSYEIMISSSEVSYRAELWREDNNEGANTPS